MLDLMSAISKEQPKPKRPPTAGSWKPGQSGNPRGRAGRGTSLIDSIRRGVDADEMRDLALELARHGESESVRLAALAWLRDSGFVKPSERHEHGAAGAFEDGDDGLDALTDEELDELERITAERDAVLERGRQRQRVSDPLVSDGDTRLLPANVAQGDR